MRPSPLQLKQYTFTNIHVKARDDAAPPESLAGFDMDGVSISERIQWGIADQNQEDPLIFGLKLSIAILNEVGKKAPYDIDVEAQGFFVLSHSIPKEARESVLVVNGCAILYGVIREQVLSLTSRGPHGAIMLPTVNFMDHKDPRESAQKI